MTQEKPLWGIDMGGTKLEGVILKSADSTDVIYRDRIATEANMGYDHMVKQLAKLVSKMQNETGLRTDTIGIGTPGVSDPHTGLMKNCNTTALNGKPLKNDLEKALGLKLVMANDANCFALAETKLGIVKQHYPEAQVVFGVIMGTGVGGGIVVNEKVLNGAQGIAGEWGHNFLDDSGGPCYCGKHGCVETVISGPSLERYYHHQSGIKRSLKEITALAELKTDAFSQATIHRLIKYFGISLSVIINILDPDVIVIGGGVGNISELYNEGLHAINQNVFNTTCETPIVKPLLGDSAGVFGAAHLAVKG